MITFKVIRYRNLLSTGNAWVEIDLCSHPRTMIVGENGHGKSTIISAITFALFGKDFRGINKPFLVNKTNEKGLEVEIELETRGKNYRIRRGVKPNIFEIYMDGTLLKQTDSSRDYQKYIEDNVLKINYNSFKQVVVIAAKNHTPFMQLPAGRRREMIEDLLDITVFSRMNAILKDRLNNTRDQLRIVEDSIKIETEKLRLNKEYLDNLRKGREDKNAKAKEEILSLSQQNSAKNVEIADLLDRAATINEQLDKIAVVSDKKERLQRKADSIKTEQRQEKKHVDFFSSHDYCPTCKQTIDEHFKQQEISRCSTNIDQRQRELAEIEGHLNKVKMIFDKRDKLQKEVDKLNRQIYALQSEIQSNERYIDRLQAELQESEADTSQEVEVELNLEQNKETIRGFYKHKQELLEKRELENIAAVLLKDSGIKTKIIQSYIPYMNALINEYLSAMDFYVKFELDENFTETIKSRYRDEFTYENFSEGEKQRIDLAILFAWRQVAKKKNSMNCNLLILDETFDSSIDANGVDDLVKILYTLEDVNLFVISHRDTMVDKFDRVLKFEKTNGFSRVKEL